MIDIKRFRADKKITQKEICDILGIAQPYLSAIEKGTRPFNEEKFKLLYKHYGDIILDYKNAGIVVNLMNDSSESRDLTCPPECTIRLLPISAMGGSLNDFFVGVKDSDCERIVSPIRGVDFAITVTGESMAPEYPSGSQVLIKRINESAFIEWGRVYVLDTVNGTIIKVVTESGEGGTVLCTSIHPDQTRYAPFAVRKTDIRGMYRVLLCMSMK